jgi:hypothetical protein
MRTPMALLRKAFGSISFGAGLGITVFAVLAIVDPVGSQMANDADPFGMPPTTVESLAYLAIGVALCVGGYFLFPMRGHR